MRGESFPLKSLASAALVGMIGVAACRPSVDAPVPDDAAQRYADAICAAHERCGCIGEGFADRDACVASSRATFEWVEGWEGVSFDLECFEKILPHLESDAECGGPLDGPIVPCLVFTGTRKTGETCILEWELGPGGSGPGGLAASSCAGNGECVTGKCTNPPRPAVQEGQPCNLTRGVFCSDDTYCGRDGTCHKEKSEGDPCDTPTACPASLACIGLELGSESLGTCASPISLGAPCDPLHVEACEGSSAGNYCSPTERVCAQAWPSVCEIVHPRPDNTEKVDWVPL